MSVGGREPNESRMANVAQLQSQMEDASAQLTQLQKYTKQAEEELQMTMEEIEGKKIQKLELVS